MNQELEDLMLEYLLRKKLAKETSPKITMTKAPQLKVINKRKSTHRWSEQDFAKVAFLYRQGYEPSAIAKEMGLRTQQIIGAIVGMQGRNAKWNAPRLLVDQS